MMHPCDRCGGQFNLGFDGNHVPHRAPCGAWCGFRPPFDLPDGSAACAAHLTGCDLAEREPVVHDLKTVAPWFGAVLDGAKTFDIRPDDRPFRVGDVLHLREYDVASGYTGRACRRRVTFAMRGYHALAPGHVALALAPCESDRTVDVWSTLYDAVVGGSQPLAVRRVEGDVFRPGDVLTVREWDSGNQRHTGRSCRRRVAATAFTETVAPGHTYDSFLLAPCESEARPDAPDGDAVPAQPARELFAQPRSFAEVFAGFGAVEAMIARPEELRVGDEFLVHELHGRRKCVRRVAFIRQGPHTVAPGYTMVGLAPAAVDPAEGPDPLASTRNRLLTAAEAALAYRKAQSIASNFSYRSAGNAEDYDQAHRDVDDAAKALDDALAAAGLS